MRAVANAKCGGRKRLAGLLCLALTAAMAACGGRSDSPDPEPQPPAEPVRFRTEVFLRDLDFPVKLAFAPDGRLFFNELRTGNIRVVENGSLRAQPFATLPVATSGERGLLGLAFDPQFASNRLVYVYHSHPDGVHRLVRLREENGIGVDATVLVDNMPSANIHNAGKIGFGSDGNLYLTVGDQADPARAQDEDSRAGKLHRFRKDGSVPADNPFGGGNPAFAMGLRNSFGLAFHPQTGTPYVSDNGPECDDRVVRIVPGGNYGWRPNYPCGDTDSRFIQPIFRSEQRIAPTGLTFYTGNRFPQFRNGLLLAEFNTGRVRHLQVDESAEGRVTSNEVVVDGGFGNLLDIVEGPDGFLYFSSANAIMRIVPE